MNEKNILFSSLGKAVSSNIKYMTLIEVEINKTQPLEIIFCVSKDQVFLLKTNSSSEEKYELYERINYEIMENIYFQKNQNQNHKINTKFSLFLNEESELQKLKELKFITDNRAMVIKNILCFYSVYYLNTKNEYKNLPTKSKTDNVNMPTKQKEDEINSTTYKFFVLNEYSFFLNHKIKQIDNQTFIIRVANSNKEYKIKFFVSDIEKMTLFEIEKDLRELSTYAYEEAYKYMIANTKPKTEKFKLVKNCNYIKKFNFNEDQAVWEGWTIRYRKCNMGKFANNKNPVTNYAFIFMRRKFLFPYYNTFRHFSIILEEESQEKDFSFSQEAIDDFELASNSLATLHKLPKFFKGILESLLNSLLIDEECLSYYLNNLKVNEVEIIRIGFAFINNVLNLIIKNEENSQNESNERFTEWGYILENCWIRIKHSFNDDNNKNSLEDLSKYYEPKNYDPNLDKIIAFIESIYNLTIFVNSEDETNNEEILDKGPAKPADNKNLNNHKKLIEEDLINEKSEIIENSDNEETPIGNNPQDPHKKPEHSQRELLNWKIKVNRFLYFCLNGGLCDYAFNFRDISNELCKIVNMDKFLYKLMNILDLDKLSKLNKSSKKNEVAVEMIALNENLNCFFNEEPVCGIIKTGTVFKLFSDNIDECVIFFKILLKEKYASNKILSSIYNLFLQFEDNKSTVSQYIDRYFFVELFPCFLTLFKNTQNTHKLLIVTKCLAYLTKLPSDKTSKLLLIQQENLNYIFIYLDKYKFDESFIILLFELLDHLIEEMGNKISDILYSNWNLMGIFQKYLSPSEIKGTYNSQSLMIIIITMILKLTKSIEAAIKEKFCEDDQSDIFKKLINICDDQGEKFNIIDSGEDYSFVLEFKIYYLLGVLIFKNSSVKNVINSKIYNIIGFFERKSKFYADLINTVLKNKDIISKAKINSIKKALTKFFEFIFYYFKVDNDDGLKSLKELIELNKTINSNREVLNLNDSDFDVFKWIKKETTAREI